MCGICVHVQTNLDTELSQVGSHLCSNTLLWGSTNVCVSTAEVQAFPRQVTFGSSGSED